MNLKGLQKMYSILSVLLLCAMLTEFCIVMPRFLNSSAGLIFVVIWGSFTVAAIVANINFINMENQKQRYKRIRGLLERSPQDRIFMQSRKTDSRVRGLR